MRYIKGIYFVIALFIGLSAYGQTITGVVTNAETNEGVIGATVRNAANGAGAITDIDGQFTIEGSVGDELTISYVGMTTQSIAATEGNMTIAMVTDATELEDIVVIGYGAQKKSEVTGSVAYVDSETIDNIKPVNAQEALQGTTPGINVTPQSGSPGNGFNIRIRGVGTNGDAAPLVIIDGYQGDINLLNPDDIESISVLKDGQAAVYGALGANGVILVKTKKGTYNQKPVVSVDSYIGMQSTSRKIPLLDPIEYATLLNEAYAANGQQLPYPNLQNVPVGSDWQNEIFEQAPMHSNTLNISGGGERITYNVGGSFLSQDGIIGSDKSNFYRGTGRASLGIDISDKLSVNTNVIYTGLNRKTINDFALGSVLFNALNAPPTLSAKDENGNLNLIPSTTGLGIEVINPLAQIQDTYNDYNLRKLNGNVQADYELIDGLTLTGRFGFNTTTSEGKTFSPIVNYGGKVFDNSRSRVDQNTQNFNDYTLDLFATYKTQLFDHHNLELVAVTTYFKEYGDGLFATGYDVPNNSWEFADIALATGIGDSRDVGSYAFDERIGSQVGRFLYNYKEKYFLSGILRRDLSTKFGPNNKDAWFNSFTAGWTLTNEDFFSSDVVDLLKLRASYGELGNDRIGQNLYLGTLNPTGGVYVFNGQIVTGRAPGRLPNPDVKWEGDKKLDFGFDLELLQNKFNIVGDYYRNTREDLLLADTPVSGITGVGAPGSGKPTVNVGGVRNSGYELGITYKGGVNNDLFYTLGYNIGTVKNEVTYVAGDGTFIEGGQFGVGNPAPARMEKGLPIGYYLGYVTDGVFQNQAEINAHAKQNLGGASAQPGDLRYKDLNDDGVINLADRTNLGGPIPEVNMGLNLQTEYKGFDFLVYTYASLGHELVRDYERTLSDVNQLNYRLNRWVGEGTSNTVPRVTAGASGNTVFSDFYVEDGSFARIQTAQIGYTFPETFTSKLKMSSARIFLKGNNLHTFTKYRGYDPSASSGAPIGSGFDRGFYPQSRSLILGANIKF